MIGSFGVVAFVGITTWKPAISAMRTREVHCIKRFSRRTKI
jgi:hypothetical protein